MIPNKGQSQQILIHFSWRQQSIFLILASNQPRFRHLLSGYLIIVYFMHKVTATKELKIHPRRRKDIKKVGLFATRTPNRPNPIGVTVVKLLERHHNVVKVQGLDALNNTPILDIKPYTYYDIRDNIDVPKWDKSFLLDDRPDIKRSL